jgi:hypothetical protein
VQSADYNDPNLQPTLDNLRSPQVAWVSLDPADRDPTRFWSYVITALDTLQPGLAADALPALQFAPAPPIDTLLTRVLNTLTSLPADAVLVLVFFLASSIDARAARLFGRCAQIAQDGANRVLEVI